MCIADKNCAVFMFLVMIHHSVEVNNGYFFFFRFLFLPAPLLFPLVLTLKMFYDMILLRDQQTSCKEVSGWNSLIFRRS